MNEIEKRLDEIASKIGFLGTMVGLVRFYRPVIPPVYPDRRKIPAVIDVTIRKIGELVDEYKKLKEKMVG